MNITPVPISPESIISVCGRQAYIRGRAYLRDGRVGPLELTHANGHLIIRAPVQGSESVPYEVEIAVIQNKKRYLPLGDCTCPMRANCKHVAAVALAYIQQFIKPDVDVTARADPVDAWLKRLQPPETQTAAPDPGTEDPRRQIYYLVQPDEHAAYRYRVATVLSRQLKKGGLGKPQPYPLERVFEIWSSAVHITEEDSEIATLILRGQRYMHHTGYPLRGELGALALAKILASGRCHWRSLEGPALRPGATRALQFLWSDENGGKRLRPVAEPPATQVLLIHDAHYIDLESGECDRLDSHLRPAQIANLLDAPVVPRDRLEEVSRRLLLEAPDYALTPAVPIDIQAVTVAGAGPVPRVRLGTRQAVDLSSPQHTVSLDFLYDRFELPPAETETLTCRQDGTTQYRIQRNLEAERAAHAELAAIGLQPLGSAAQTRGVYAFPWMGPLREAQSWQTLLDDTLPRLEAAGWRVERDSGFNLRFEEAGQWLAEWSETPEDGWFSLSLGVEVDGEPVNLLPALVEILSLSADPAELRAWLADQPHVLAPVGDGRWLKLPTARVLAIYDTLVELYDQSPLDADGKLRFSRLQALQLGELADDSTLVWHGSEDLQALARRLRDFAGIHPVDPPAGLQAELRQYQRQGLSWLAFLREYGFNGILADDMGLGKTLQTLALILREKEQGRLKHPCLIVAPTSLMGNWRREAERFTPALRVLTLHGAERKARFNEITEHDLVLTSYALARRDWDTLNAQTWHYLILDEAQAIKNPQAFTTQTLRLLKADHKLCLTGTPMENHLGELWSIFEFLMPGLLGSQERFARLFRRPIEQHGDIDRSDQLCKRIRPFVLRRTKKEVASELPDKVEIVRAVALEGKQRDLYESVRLAMDRKVREAIGKQGLARSHIMILDALLKLRQICCDPRLVKLDRARQVKGSTKLELLMELVPEMVEEGRKILIFSQFTTMLGLIEAELERRRIRYTKLTGQTRDRDRAVAAFQQGDASVFLISLKAGGVGLNLTAADTVIHYDPWWNPAVENQATDRAHRIGQDKTVFVYKLITENTVEDKMLALQQKKQALADTVHGKATAGGPTFTADELLDLFEPLG